MDMHWKSLLYILTLGLACATQICRNISEEYLYHLATLTPYRLIANKNVTELNFAGCQPRKIWMIIRHGARNPSAYDIKEMKKRLPAIRDLILENNLEGYDFLSNTDLKGFRKWQTKLEQADNQLLAREGKLELLKLAKRMQARFPSIFPATYSNESYLFKYAKSQRTEANAKYFARGLFGRKSAEHVWYPPALKKDPTLEFYTLCKKWQREVRDNFSAFGEVHKFKNSQQMKNAIELINCELNLDVDLSLDDINLMYRTCGFETAWNRETKSPWCSAFPLVTLKAMEFLEDLKRYYRDGYGYKISYQQACPPFKDAMDHFENISEYPNAIVYFTHYEALSKLVAYLGLYKDSDPLLATHFGRSYKWRSSKISTFATNLAFILYRCSCGPKLRVAVLHQEQLVKLPSCNNLLCDLAEIKRHYSESIYNCFLDKICANLQKEAVIPCY